MSKRKKPATAVGVIENSGEEKPPIENPISLGLATHISWRLNLSEADAVKAAEIIDQWSGDLSEGAQAFARCESPAERLFLLGFLLDGVCDLVDWSDYSLEFGQAPDRLSRPFAANLERDEETFNLYQQAIVGDFRVDFLMEFRGSNFGVDWGLAIEIDGHDFHERTKEQAAHDKSRDRNLVALGYHTLRFTGSEVYANPGACAKQALDIAVILDSKRSAYESHVIEAYRAGETRALQILSSEDNDSEPKLQHEAAE
jgi:very-short-patch-repair endonuclease